jgi:hypothetical protein
MRGIAMRSPASVLPTDRLLVAGEEPPLGAHLVTPRVGFTHHGIYAGHGKVIHYGSLGESLRRRPVEEVSVERFAHQHAVWMRAPRTAGPDGATVVRRARSRIGEDRYSLFSNNCEHFCEWCTHGEQRSYQVERIVEVQRRVLLAASLVLPLLLALPLLRGLLA